MEALSYVIAFVMLFFFNVVVLIIAMFLLRMVMADLEFGSFTNLLWRGAILAAIVSGVQLIPCVGMWISLAVWAGGLVVLFEMDVRNCLIAGGGIWIISLGFSFALRALLA
jgi:hypothetical protein